MSTNESGLKQGIYGRWAIGLAVVIAIAGAAFYLTAGKEQPPAAARVAAPGSQELDALTKQYADLERFDEETGGLREVSAEAFQKEIATRGELLEKVRKVSATGLSSEEDIDRRLMIGLLEATNHTNQARRIWENDASLYVPAAEIGRALEPSAPGTPLERATALTALLGDVPARLEQGKRNLVKPPLSYTQNAVFKTEGTIKILGGSAPVLAKQAGESGAALMAASKTAQTALEGYLRFLRDDLLPRSTGTWVLGKENYDYILQHRWMMQTDADAILARGWQSFKETEALAQEVAQRIEPGKDWITVYEHLKDDHPAADGIKQAYQTKIDAAKAFLIEHKIVTLPAGERVITIDTPPAMRRSSPFGTFQSVDQFDAGLEGKLVLTPF
jgi:uncharacterized protein (DUF885 family)